MEDPPGEDSPAAPMTWEAAASSSVKGSSVPFTLEGSHGSFANWGQSPEL